MLSQSDTHSGFASSLLNLGEDSQCFQAWLLRYGYEKTTDLALDAGQGD